MAQSGGGREIVNATGLREGLNGRPSAEQIGVAFAAGKGINGNDATALQKLRALPAESLVDDLNMATMQAHASTFPGPMIDGNTVVGRFDDLYSEGKNQKVPMLAGANNMDIGFAFGNTPEELFAAFGSNAQAARKAYDPSGSDNIAALSMAVGADALMLEPARFSLRVLAAQGLPVWEYRFSYVATSTRSQWRGAPHATEIPYVFDTVKEKYVSALRRRRADRDAGERLLEQLRKDRKSERTGAARLAEVCAIIGHSDELHSKRSEGRTGSPQETTRSHGGTHPATL